MVSDPQVTGYRIRTSPFGKGTGPCSLLEDRDSPEHEIWVALHESGKYSWTVSDVIQDDATVSTS